MTQAYEKITEMNIPEVEEIEKPEVKTQMKSEVDELLGDLNPRYFEETYSFDQAMQKIHASKTNFNLI